MKVLNLGCAHDHVFEGWFGSEDDFQDQLTRGLLECPLCGDKAIEKKLSAPRLNLKSSASDDGVQEVPSSVTPVSAPSLPNADWQSAMVSALQQLVAKTEDVGERFVSEARRMHYGETERRNIRGQASMAEAVELLEEGVEVLPLPDLPILKKTLQ